jgi:hypothetical protein
MQSQGQPALEQHAALHPPSLQGGRRRSADMAGFNLTARDLEVLETLATRIRVLTIGQVAGHWFGGSWTVAQRRMASLRRAGLLHLFTMQSRPPLSLREPMFAWEPSAATPDFHALSYACCVRWNQPTTPTQLVVASPAGCVRFACKPTRQPRRSEVSHDVTLGGVYLAILKSLPEIAQTWQSEGTLRSGGFGDRQKLPDAMVLRECRLTVVELGGTYPAQRLEELHRFCAGRRLPYELW